MKVCSPLFAVAIAAAVFAPRARGATCTNQCNDASCTAQPISATTATVTAPTATCEYGKQYVSALKISSDDGAVGITVAFKQGTAAVTASSTDFAAATGGSGSDTCYLTYADVGKTDSLTNDVKFDVTCASSATSCPVHYAATWACQRDPNWCTTDLVGDASSTAKTITKATGTWDLTNPDSCPTGFHSYISSLKVGSRAKSAFTVTFAGPATAPTAISGSSVGTCYYEYGKAPNDPSLLAQDVKVTVTCTDTTADCVVQAKPVWGCDAPACSTPVTGGTDQVLAAGTGAGSSFVLKKPDAKTCPAGQIAYPKNLVVGGKYAAHNVAVKFNNGLTPTLDVTSVDSCYLAYGLNPVGNSPVTTDVTATITCKDTTKPCTAQYKVDSWECLTPACLATCTDCTDGPAFSSAKSTITPTSKSCTYGRQYLSAFQATAASGNGIKVAFKHGSTALTPTETDKKTNGVSTATPCSWTYADVGKTDTLSADVGVEVTCADSSATSCPYKYTATWTCQRDPALCALECDDADPACKDQTIDIGGKLELTKTEDCPTFNYLKSLKIGSKSKKNIAVTFDGASARVPKAKVDSCYFSYGQIPANPTTLLKNVKATVKCADASAACTVQASPTWACDAPVCGKTIGTGGTAQTINAGANFAISKPSSKMCASGEIAYPKNLIIGGAFTAYSVGVSFNNGLKPTPTDSSGDCYFAYGPNPVGSSPVSSDVAVTVTCKDPTKPCKIQYKLDSWECYAPVCQDSCTAGTCKTGSVTAAGGKVAISATAATCPSGAYQYISALKASADTGDAIVVTFKDGTTALSPVPTATQNKTNGINTDPCSWTYTDVGKTAALGHDVSAEITCKDPATASCAFKYDVTWACQRDPALCAMEAAGSDQAIDMGKSVELTTTAECPTFNYLKSLKVGSKVKEDIKVTFTGGGVAPTASPKVDSCYFEYGQTPTDLTALTASVKATVACVSTTAGCTVQAVPEWACTVSQCAKLVTGGTDTSIDVAKTVVVAKPSGKTCTGGFAYPKDLVVGGKFTSSNVTVTFNNGLTPTPSDSSNDCYFAFADPVGTSTVTSDVTATIACKDATKACTAQVRAPTWDCYTPPDLTKVYTRTEADGKSCQDVSTCASRCAKSYAMGKKDGKVTFVPQLVPADCDCPVLTATPAGDGLTATDSGTTMSATFATATDPMTIEYSADDHKCKYTYTKAAFTNPFAEKVFTFKTVTPNTDDCVLPNDCDYVCAAEMTVAKQGDAIQVWRKPVGDCPCTNTTAYTNDDGETASGSTGPVAYLFDALSATSISLNTTVDGTTCRLMYEEKPAPPPPAPTDPVTDAPKPSTAPTNAPTNAPSPTTPATTTKTGTSAGVSAMGGGAGAGVTTVTLIAAAAGVQAVGLPAN